MPYTVKQLAKLSGVSIRTLHHYDEIGLLAPAYYGDNQYRYYEVEQLLKLQQILFYRELGFQLNVIKSIFQSKDFDKVKALESHKDQLSETLNKTRHLIKTIDKTIAHLRGETMIKLEEIFDGFDEEKQALYEEFLIQNGVKEEVIDEVQAKIKHWNKEQWLANKRENDKLYAELAEAVDAKLAPSSTEVQALIKKHYELTKLFWTPDQESYIGLGEFYGSNPDFVKFYDDIHPQLLGFLQNAMKIFAEKNLS